MTFEQAGFHAEDSNGEVPPPLAPSRQSSSPAPAFVDGPEARRIDSALLAFSTRERLLRFSQNENKLFPAEAERAWTTIFKEVDAFLTAEPSRTPALELTRAFVTLDAELEMDRRTWSAIPAAVKDGSEERRGLVRDRLAQVKTRPLNRQPTDLTWPISPPLVTSLFGDRVDPFTGNWAVHRGVDIAAQKGQLVTAAAPGVVSVAQWLAGHGLHVEVDHADGTVTRYSHLSMVLTSAGTRLERGDPIGLAGNTGRSTGPHLHFEVWRDGRAVDPLGLLSDSAIDRTTDVRPVQRSARRGPGPTRATRE
jgi:murein DD-endopeptidase MepM/ murein hydrolase activator NlpD